VSRSWWPGNISSLPEHAEERERAGQARAVRETDCGGLEKIMASCRKRKQLPAVVGQRVGRLLGQNSRAAGAFAVKIDADVDGFAKCRWKEMDRWREWARLSEGCMCLRSNVTDWNSEELWRAYMQLTEAEAAFRIHKTDLQLRPIWHQRQERVEAHILVCFLAYVLWKTLAQLCQRAGLGNEPRKVFQELAEITLVDVVLPTRNGVPSESATSAVPPSSRRFCCNTESALPQLARNGPSVVKTRPCPH